MKTNTTKMKSIVGLCKGRSLTIVCAGILLVLANVAQAQNLFITDDGSGRILELPLGNSSSWTTFANGLNHPYGLAFDSAGNLFEADASSGNIYEFKNNSGTLDSTPITFASGLSSPFGLACNGGNLFEVDRGSGHIYEFASDGTRSTFASGLSAPAYLAFDGAGNLFASASGSGSTGSGSIYEFAPDGTQSTFASGLSFPMGLALNSAGDLFESDYESYSINEFTPDGTQSTFASGIFWPVGLALNSAGDLFVADSSNGSVYEFAPGYQNGDPLVAIAQGMNGPTDVAIQPVPEPSTWALIGTGAVTLLGFRRRRTR